MNFSNMIISKYRRDITYPYLTLDIVADNDMDYIAIRIFGTGTTIYWGDGESSVCNANTGDAQHTYAPGTYTLSIARSYGVPGLSVLSATCNIVSSNEAWEALPNMRSIQFNDCKNSELRIATTPQSASLVSYNYSFQGCSAAVLPISKLPANLLSATAMFDGCHNSILPFSELPDSLAGDCRHMFSGCSRATFKITRIPDSVHSLIGFAMNCTSADIRLNKLPYSCTTIESAFYNSSLVANLDELAENAPDGGYTDLTNIKSAFTQCAGVTGSRSRFLSACPNLEMSSSDIEFAFVGTNTTE